MGSRRTHCLELNEYRLLAPWSNRCNRELCAGYLSNSFQVRACFRRKVLPLAGFVSRLVPAGEFRIDRFAASKQFDVVRHIVVALSPYAISDADLDRFHSVEAI